MLSGVYDIADDWGPKAIIIQRLIYGNAPPAATLMEDDDIEQALALAEE